MEDKVIFLQDLIDEECEVNFIKGRAYLILSEDKEYIYVQSKKNTNEVCAIHKNEIGKLIEVN